MLKLVAISVVVTFVWFWWLQLRYAAMFGPAAKFAFRTLGIQKSGHLLVLEHFTSLVPFIALSLSLPNGFKKKRLLRLGIGITIIAAAHYLLLIAVSAVYAAHGLTGITYKYIFPMLTINDALPLLLWIVLFAEEIRALFHKAPSRSIS